MEKLNWFGQDLRFAVRGIKKDRGFALLAIFALALGIGATTVIFSVIENVLIEPFPYRDADRLAVMQVHDLTKPTDYDSSFYTMPQFLDIREQNHVFGDVMGVSPLERLVPGQRRHTAVHRGVGDRQCIRVPRNEAIARPEHCAGRRKARGATGVLHKLSAVEEGVQCRSSARWNYAGIEWRGPHPDKRHAAAILVVECRRLGFPWC